MVKNTHLTKKYSPQWDSTFVKYKHKHLRIFIGIWEVKNSYEVFGRNITQNAMG